ncbi:MAG: methyltransferase domain-containing protein [Desulfuromonadales bacterium]|nr:methyltransferase domain-containing protein [Desulfuromonadales bacterium]
MNSLADSLENHYAPHDLEVAVLNALVAAGKDPDRLVPEDLSAIDEFHIRGRKATSDLASRLQLNASTQVLDAGCGLGGASRYLAAVFGCKVTGVDITEPYCRVATMLAMRLGLADRVSYRHCDALAMPFADSSFDVVWTQHATMNISDKFSFYEEILRVLKPGGVLASYDILSGTGGDVYYPVPWARDTATSFLVSPKQMRNVLEDVGFEIEYWQDTTEIGRCWFKRMGDKLRNQGVPPLGIHILLGDDFQVMAQNQVRNLEEDCISLIEAVVRRPAGS